MSRLPVLFVFLPLVFAACPASVLMATSDTSKVELSPQSFADPVTLLPHPLWVHMDGASWVWTDTFCAPSAENNYEWQDTQCLASSAKFVSTFFLPEWKRGKIESLTLSVTGDNTYEIVFNGNVIAPSSSGWYTWIAKYQLKDLFLGSDGRIGKQENRLEIMVNNTDGPGGLAFKVEMTYK